MPQAKISIDEYIDRWGKILKHTIDQLGQPDHPSGYTISYLKDKFEPYEWEAFSDFMKGSTMLLSKDGEAVIYLQDIANYLYQVKRGKVLFWD